MKTADVKKVYREFRRIIINTRQTVPIGNPKSGRLFRDYMTENYETDHEDLIQFMESEEVFNQLKTELPESVRGFLQVYVRKIDDSFEIYGVRHIPYHIIYKEWGLGFKNENPKEFFQVRCLFENDYTGFRCSYKK